MSMQNGAELVKKMKAVYCLKVLQGDKVGMWVIDVKNGSGSVRFDPAGTVNSSFYRVLQYLRLSTCLATRHIRQQLVIISTGPLSIFNYLRCDLDLLQVFLERFPPCDLHVFLSSSATCWTPFNFNSGRPVKW